MSSKFFGYAVIGALFVATASAWAQFLPVEHRSNVPVVQKKSRPLLQNSKKNDFAGYSENETKQAEVSTINERDSVAQQDAVKDADTAEKDAVRIIDKNGKRVYDEVILLYMKSFNVYRTASQQVRCAVRFAATTTYQEKVSNVSYELKWPKMVTRLSFTDMEPQVEYYIDYLLLGEGCYTMDKRPNIIVNRCRVKNKTQEDCAASVRWIKWDV